MTIIGYQHDDSCLPEYHYQAHVSLISGEYWTADCPCRDGYHVWLTSSNTTTGGRIQEGQRCACGAMEWRGDHEVPSDEEWRLNIMRRLAEIERRLDGR